MTDLKRYGATPDEWAQVSGTGMAAWVLPIASNLTLPISPRSTLQTPGKVPSTKNANGEIIGIPGWTTAEKTTAAQIEAWRKDPDLGFCIRTGHDGYIALDCDADDPATAEDIENLLIQICGLAPGSYSKRQRGNARWAILVHIKDDTGDRAKQVISLPPAPTGAPQALEILGTGQQLACAGTHPRGTRYSWTAGIKPLEMAAATLQSFIDTVAMIYGTGNTQTGTISARQRGTTYAAPDRMADWLTETGRVLKEGINRELFIKCPWESDHTASTGPSETVYFPAGSNGYPEGGFKCLHAHCSHRKLTDFLAWAKLQGYTDTSPENYPNEAQKTAESPASADGKADCMQPTAGERLQAYRSEKTGYIEPCATSVYIAMGAPEIAGHKIAYDTFRGRVVTRPQEAEADPEAWAVFTEEKNLELRIALEKYGFKPGSVSKDLITDAVRLVASEHLIDTMRDYLDRTLPAWDGTPRAERFLTTYCGADDTPYTRAVGRYLWGMLWRRASSPTPIKADISLVLIGAQGANKTRFIKALALLPETHTELNFNLSASELAMRMGGRIIAEFPEMIGFGKRKLEEIKAFLTLDADTYRPLYSSDQRTVTRRCLFIMTTNNIALFSDRTGNRRYAPVKVGRFNADDIKPDLLQLWAEGKEIFKKYGGLRLHQDVEQITAVENENFVLPDSWETAVAEWIDAQEKMPESERAVLQSRTILNCALGFDDKLVKRDDLTRLSEIMQALGYTYTTRRAPQLGGKPVKVWVTRADR